MDSLGLVHANANTGRGGRAAATATRAIGSTAGGSQTGVDGLRTSLTDGAHLGSTRARGGLSRAARSLAIEVTGGRTAGLLGVAVHGPSETLLGIAHGVGTVGTFRSVGVDTGDSVNLTLLLQAVQVVVGALDVLVGDVIVGNTLERVVHALAEVGVGRRRKLASSHPVAVYSRARTANGGGDLVVSAVDTGSGDLLHLGREVVEVLLLGDGASGGGDETVVVASLEVHVDDTTAPDIIHLITEENGDVVERTGFGALNTAILGEESGNRVILEFLSAVLVTGLLEGGITAELVDVVTEEVDGVISAVADQVVGDILTDILVVIGSVTNSQGRTVLLVLDVCLHVTDGSLDVSHGSSVVVIVRDLITSEETNDVGVRSESVDNLGVTSEQFCIPLGVGGNNGLFGSRQITDDVDSSIGQGVHAVVVRLVRVDSVGTNNVGAEREEVWDITFTSGSINERIDVAITATRLGSAIEVGLISNTTNEELGTVVGVEEFLALNLNGGDRALSQSGAHKGQAGEKGELHSEVFFVNLETSVEETKSK